MSCRSLVYVRCRNVVDLSSNISVVLYVANVHFSPEKKISKSPDVLFSLHLEQALASFIFFGPPVVQLLIIIRQVIDNTGRERPLFSLRHFTSQLWRSFTPV